MTQRGSGPPVPMTYIGTVLLFPFIILATLRGVNRSCSQSIDPHIPLSDALRRTLIGSRRSISAHSARQKVRRKAQQTVQRRVPHRLTWILPQAERRNSCGQGRMDSEPQIPRHRDNRHTQAMPQSPRLSSAAHRPHSRHDCHPIVTQKAARAIAYLGHQYSCVGSANCAAPHHFFGPDQSPGSVKVSLEPGRGKSATPASFSLVSATLTHACFQPKRV